MKIYEQAQLEKRPGFVIAMIIRIPEGEDRHSDHPENAANDLHDVEGVEKEPQQSDIDRAVRGHVQPVPDEEDEELGTPYDSEDEDAEGGNLDDAEDLMGEDSEIDDETTI